MTDTQRKIEEALDGFDFERMYTVMRFLNWTWTVGKPGEYKEVRPTADALRTKAQSLLARVASSVGEEAWLASGGLLALKSGESLRLSFECTHTYIN